MIKEMLFEGLRGQYSDGGKCVLDFSRSTDGSVSLVGPSGQGKTTLGHAIAYAFTGKDMYGNGLPIHLISDDEDVKGAKITVTTHKATITRTLTKKKNGSLKMEMGNKIHDMTQKDLSNLIGEPHVFLSAFSAGFFMNYLDKNLRTTVLENIMPKIDREEVIKKIYREKTDYPYNFSSKYDFTKNPNSLKTAIMEDKRKATAKLSEALGKLEHIEEELAPLEDLEEIDPIFTEELSRQYDAMFRANVLWNNYREAMKRYDEAVASREKSLPQVESLKEKIEDVRKQKQLLSYPEKPDNSEDLGRIDELSSKIEDIRKQKAVLEAPDKPNPLTLSESPRCHSCGQVVSEKYKDQVRKDNETMLSAYREDLHKYDAAIVALDAEIEPLEKDISEIKARVASSKKEYDSAVSSYTRSYAHLTREENNLRSDLSFIQTGYSNVNPPEQPEQEEPVPFEMEKVRKELHARRSEVEQNQAKARLRGNLKLQKQSVESSLSKLESDYRSLEALYDSLKDVDKTLVTDMSDHMDLGDGVYFTHEGKEVSITMNGRDYKYLSSGERIFADMKICEKIANMLSPKIKMIFVDNYNLCSTKFRPSVEQVFYVETTEDVYDSEGGSPIQGEIM